MHASNRAEQAQLAAGTKSPHERFRPYGVKVTDLSAQLWCERQLDFSLTRPKRRTFEMKKGEDIHAEKEAELYDLVEVSPKTREDRLLLKLGNAAVAVEGLLNDGKARELPLWGKLNSLKVVGIADEAVIEDGKLLITETKTRKTPTLPRIAQYKTAVFQLMAYKELTDRISSGAFAYEDLLKQHRFDAGSAASPQFVLQHKELGLELEPNVLRAAEGAFALIRKIPQVEKMRVTYEHQGTGQVIKTHDFSFDPGMFWEHCGFCEGFWQGARQSLPVRKDPWKCSYCDYRNECKDACID